MTQGVLIGWIGTALGVGLGLALALNVDVIVPFLERTFGFHIMDSGRLLHVRHAERVHPADVVRIGTAAFILTAAARPCIRRLRARTTQPAEALRYE